MIITKKRLTWPKDRPENWQVFHQNIGRIKRFFVEIDNVLEQRFHVVRPVIVGETLVTERSDPRL